MHSPIYPPHRCEVRARVITIILQMKKLRRVKIVTLAMGIVIPEDTARQ